MKRCPKCGYIRQPKDDELFSPEECPKCHTIYKKYGSYLAQKKEEQEAKRITEEQAKREEQKKCSKCGDHFDSHLFGLLPWNCPICEGRYWDQKSKHKEKKVLLYSVLAFLLVLLIGIAIFSPIIEKRRLEIAKQEQAERLRIEKEQEEERLRIEEEKEKEAKRLIVEKQELAKKKCFKAYKALKRIEATMESGANYQSYSEAVIDATLELNLIEPDIEKSIYKALEGIIEDMKEGEVTYQSCGETINKIALELNASKEDLDKSIWILADWIQLNNILTYYQVAKSLWADIVQRDRWETQARCKALIFSRLFSSFESSELFGKNYCYKAIGDQGTYYSYSDGLKNLYVYGCAKHIREKLWIKASKYIKTYEKERMP